jgi:hypothetical protein
MNSENPLDPNTEILPSVSVNGSVARSKRVGMAVCVVLALVLMAAAAVPWYSSRMVSEELHAMASQRVDAGLRIRELVHDAGWLSSHGSMVMEWRNQCDEGPDEPASVRVNYTARHFPDFKGLTRFEWSAEPSAGGAGRWQTMLGSVKMQGTGHVAYDGTLVSAMQLPELNLRFGGETMEVAPSRGHIERGAHSMRFDWVVDRLVARGRGRALEAQQLSVHMDLKDRELGLGSLSVDLGSLSTDAWSLRGLHVGSHTSQREDRLDSRLTESVQTLEFGGQNLSALAIEAELKGVHTESALSIGKIVSETCALRNATVQERQQFRTAIKKVLLAGFSFGIPKLTGSGKEGGLDGDFALTLAPAQGQEVMVANQLSSRGQIRIQGALMPPEQRAYALSTGFASDLPDGLQTSFEYGAGVLKVSGKTLDGAMVQLGLQRLDVWLKVFLSGKEEAEIADEQPGIAPAEAPTS